MMDKIEAQKVLTMAEVEEKYKITVFDEMILGLDSELYVGEGVLVIELDRSKFPLSSFDAMAHGNKVNHVVNMDLNWLELGNLPECLIDCNTKIDYAQSFEYYHIRIVLRSKIKDLKTDEQFRHFKYMSDEDEDGDACVWTYVHNMDLRLSKEGVKELTNILLNIYSHNFDNLLSINDKDINDSIPKLILDSMSPRLTIEVFLNKGGEAIEFNY